MDGFKKPIKSLSLQEKGSRLIPGLTQLLSKRPDQFAPKVWPGYYEKAEGQYVWDLDGNRYLDMSIAGIGANVLGYCDPDVDKAVLEAVRKGNSTSLSNPEEVELAELLVDMHPWAQMVRYARCGGEAMAVAVRIARAFSRRDKVAFCGYHGWHDWYLAANLQEGTELSDHLLPGLQPRGVPRGLTGTALPFRYNRLDELENIVKQHGKDLGAIVLESIRNDGPEEKFKLGVRAIADELKIPLVVDEISSGFRLNTGGAHLKYGIQPDIAVFAKAISNGYPMAAIIGRAQVMQVVQETFISSTYWTDRIGPSAALATMRKFQKNNVATHLVDKGLKVQSIWKKYAAQNQLGVHVGGIPPLSHFSFDGDNGRVLMTLFVQQMLKRNILAANRFYSMYAHTDAAIDTYEKGVKEVFASLAGKSSEELEALLEGPVAKAGFHRLT